VIDRQAPRIVGIGLLLLIGLSGLLVGLQLVLALLSVNGGREPTGWLIGGGIAAYGLLLTGAAIGLILQRRIAFAIAVFGLVLGLIGLAALSVIDGLDGVFTFGVGIWLVALVCVILGRRQ
jgi:hypothetical protein